MKTHNKSYKENPLFYNKGDVIYRNNAGQYHRENGPAIENADGSQYWFFNGKRHNLNGPACISTHGTKEWFVNGNLHRIGGPAIEFNDGFKFWYVNNEEITKEQHDLLCSIMKLKGLL